jgi:hypothetical protein
MFSSPLRHAASGICQFLLDPQYPSFYTPLEKAMVGFVVLKERKQAKNDP